MGSLIFFFFLFPFLLPCFQPLANYFHFLKLFPLSSLALPPTFEFLLMLLLAPATLFASSFLSMLLYCLISSGDGWVELYAAAAKSPQSCPTLCDPRDGSPPGSPVPGILQARVLEWGAIAFSDPPLKQQHPSLGLINLKTAEHSGA